MVDRYVTLSTRPIAAADWLAYKDVRLRALQDAPDAFGTRHAEVVDLPDEHWRSRVANLSAERDLPLFAVCDGLPVGLAWGRIEAAEPQHAHLYQMWVAPAHRHLGLGRMLVDTITAWAKAQGADAVLLTVTCGNAAAEGLYESTGFVRVGDPKPLRPGTDLLEQAMVCDLAGRE